MQATHEINLSILIEWGLPLSDPNLPITSGSALDQFRYQIHQLLKLNLDSDSRENRSSLGLLWALHTHYPSLFPEIRREWLEAKPFDGILKLRRIALARFSRRLKMENLSEAS